MSPEQAHAALARLSDVANRLAASGNVAEAARVRRFHDFLLYADGADPLTAAAAELGDIADDLFFAGYSTSALALRRLASDLYVEAIRRWFGYY